MPYISARKLKILGLSSLLFWVPIILFAGIANEVTERTPLPGDVAILDFIHRTFPAGLSQLFLYITNVGGIISILAALIAFCAYRKRLDAARVLLAGVAGAALANVIIKLLFQRQRPTLWQSIIHENGFSFPSGHAMVSSALVFALIYVTWRTRWRWVAIVIGIPFMLLVGLSRLYFGVHYPSDIAAGWLASLAWVSIVVLVLSRPAYLEFQKRLHAVYLSVFHKK